MRFRPVATRPRSARLRIAASCAALLALPAGCGTSDVSDGPVRMDVDQTPFENLSEYRFFKVPIAALQPNDGVVPYDLNTQLFSDYTTKHRFVWMPPGAAAEYQEESVLELPVGSVVIKTFTYLHDLRDPSQGRRILETRLLVHRTDGWEGLIYVWNDAQTEATLHLAGKTVDVSWTHTNGETRTNNYIIPNQNQCKGCHENNEEMDLIGPKAGNLNRAFPYPDGSQNQLRRFAQVGYLTGAPDPAAAPVWPRFDDPATGSLDERARVWLDVQCAHCHNPEGPARTSALDLRFAQIDPTQFGLCKPPIAAGRGSGGRRYDIIPGNPNESILVFRIESTDPGIRMPELPIRLVHDEGVSLVRDWIAAMPGSCP